MRDRLSQLGQLFRQGHGSGQQDLPLQQGSHGLAKMMTNPALISVKASLTRMTPLVG